MGTEDNKQLVLSWLEAGTSGDTDRSLNLLHDDFRHFITGSMPISGWHDRDEFFRINTVLAPQFAGPFTIRIGDITAEDDRVLLEVETDVPLASGKRYNNHYVWSVRVRDGKIAEFRDYGDTLHVYDSFDVDEVRGGPKDRESPIEHVTHTFGGAAADPA